MPIAALFILPNPGNNPDEWINKLWYICTNGYYSGIKKKPAIKPQKDMKGV